MVALKEILSLTSIVITFILSSSHCQSVSNVEENNVSKYQKFMAKHEESLTSNNKWIPIRNTRQCGSVLARIIDQIIQVYIPEENLLCILTDKAIENNCFANFFKDLSKLGKRSVVSMILGARNFDSRQVIYQKPTIYFLLGTDVSAVLKPLMNFGKMGGTWNPRGFYISIAESKEEAVNIMTSLWKNVVYKVIVLVLRNNTLNTIEAYTWRPYYPSNYCGSPTVKNIIRLGKFTETLQFQKEIDTKPGTMPKTFGNCPFNISFNIWEPFVYSRVEERNLSLELNLIQMICEKIGVRMNPTFHDLTLAREPSEAWAGTHIPRASDVERYEISVPYIQDSLIWVIPCCEEIPFILTDGFPSSLWIPSALAMIVVVVPLIACGKKNWILWVWGSFWEQSDYKVPKKVRGIWGCWLLLCLHLSVAYKTVLFSRLTNTLTEEGIQNQSDLLRSGLKLSFLDVAVLWFDEDDEIHKKILEQYEPCETVIKCYKEIPTGRAVFTNEMFVNYLNGQRAEMGSIAEKTHQLPTSLTYKVAMICTKGHAILPRFNKFIIFTMEAGFIDYWINKIKEKQAKIKTNRLNFTRGQQFSLVQTRGIFQLLMTGLLIAVVLFLCEIFYHMSMAKFSSYIKKRF